MDTLLGKIYTGPDEEALWAQLYDATERAGLSKVIVHRWIGATPGSLGKCQSPAHKERILLLMQALIKCLNDKVADGTLPVDVEYEFLNDLFNNWHKQQIKK